MNYIIRPEVPLDIRSIHNLIRMAFSHAPHTSHTEPFIVDALRDSGALEISLLADKSGEVIGHLAVSSVLITDGARGWYGLGPVSVHPKYQGQGVGSSLIGKALNTLREMGASGCTLLGDPAYYSRFGFEPVPGLFLPNVPPEYFLIYAFQMPLPQGEVTYHAAFNATGEQISAGNDR